MSTGFQHRFKGKMNLIDKTGFITPIPLDPSLINRRPKSHVFLQTFKYSKRHNVKSLSANRYSGKSEALGHRFCLSFVRNRECQLSYDGVSPLQERFKGSGKYLVNEKRHLVGEEVKELRVVNVIKPKIKLEESKLAKNKGLLALLMNESNHFRTRKDLNRKRVIRLPAINCSKKLANYIIILPLICITLHSRL
eukprot:TRINITY_DN2907_c0_g1_i10.p1 TRINITY_DN2907_c0_g1~~TRINITY_DN2907_c0_g1_i10.p1  ORF type:complete len:194 (+),score=18.11 TRINITY_DN2907_c0_g1_i10:146-727(+)